MPELPKIVHQRLRAVTPEQVALMQAHPEANVLAAFAEQALPAPEREDLLRHLALCADCRDVVTLALPAENLLTRRVEEVEEEERDRELVVASAGARSAKRKPRSAGFGFGWANLRWAVLAAGIGVAIFIMRPTLERTAKAPSSPTFTANKSVAEAKPAVIPEIGLASVPENSSAKDKASGNRREEKKSLSAPMGPVSPLAGEGQADLKQRGHSGANAKGVAGFAKDSMAAPAAGLVLNLRARPGASNGASRSSATGSSPTESERARENVTIEAANSEATTLSKADSNQIARAEWPDLNSAPEIVKAKPALDTSSANAPQGDVMQKSESPSTFFAGGPAHVAGGSKIASHDTIAQVPAAPIIAKQPASWMVADGALKRSVDGGQTWQATTSADRPVLCYSVRGRDVWAGGQAGMLLRSTDNGTTWSAVAVSFHGQPLSSAVTRIDTSAPAEIVLSTDNHETWSSLDAGKTWTKK